MTTINLSFPLILSKNSFLIIFGLLLIFSCSEKNLSYDYPQDLDIARKSRAGKFFNGSDLIIYGKKKQEKPEEKVINKNQTDNKLWNSSLEVISKIIPIDTIDSNAKLITSNWYQNDSLNTNKRIKISLLVKGAEIKEENLIISVFKQKIGQDGQWQDDHVDQAAIKHIKERIIATANGTKIPENHHQTTAESTTQVIKYNSPKFKQQPKQIVYSLQN